MSATRVLLRRRRHGDGRTGGLAASASVAVRRSRWRLVLLVGGAVLVGYYGLVVAGMQGRDSSEVPLDAAGVSPAADGVTVEVEAAELDPSTGSLDVRLRPVPRGDVAGDREGQLGRPLVVEVRSPGEPPQSFDFAAGQLVDPVAVTVATTTGAHRFPFDRAESQFRVTATSRDEPVPVEVAMTDQTEGWSMSGRARENGDGLLVTLDAGREVLPISFAIFYIAGIVVVALITVAVIGGAIARGQVDFDQVIWLGAMLVAMPAVRNEMPGVPPIGTAVDLFVFLPSVVIVGMALLASIVVLAVNEAAAARDDGEAEAEPSPDPTPAGFGDRA